MQQKLQFQSGTCISLPSPQYPQRQFKILQILGKGGQGDVYQVQPQGWGAFKSNAALKVQSEMRQAEREFITNLFHYQNKEDNLPINQRTQMIKIYDIVEYQGASIIIMEHGQESLYDYIQNNRGKLKINDKIQILKQISQGIWFLHFNKQIHRDIKPENFVRVGDEFKLIDFGLVKQIQIENTRYVGSPLFQAPEVRNGQQNYSYGVDIWSLGGTFYEILTEDQLQQINFQNMTIKSPDQINQNFQIQLRELLQNMMQTEPHKRITIKQVMESLNQIEFLLQPINAPLMNAPLPKQNQNMQFQQPANNNQHQQASKSVGPQIQNPITGNSNSQQNHQPFQINNQPKQANNPPVQTNNFMNQQGQIQNLNFHNGAVPPLQNNQNNNNFKLELQQQLEKQIVQIFQQCFTSFTTNFQNHFVQQIQMIKEQNVQNLTEIQNIKQEQLNSYQDMQQLIQEQNKQIERIPIQHQKHNIQIGSQVNNEQIEVKLSELNQLLTNSQKEQKEIQWSLYKLIDSNNESKVEIQKQQDIQFKNMFQQLDKMQQQQQNQEGQQHLSQDNSSQQLNQILNEQQEMKETLQFLYQINSQQQRNFMVPNQNIDPNQIQLSLTKIEKEIKKQNEEVKQQILDQLQQIQDENSKLARNIQNNDKNTKRNESQSLNEQFIKEILEAIQGVNKNLQNQMNQASIKEINQQLTELNKFNNTQNKNNYLEYFLDFSQQLKELKLQLEQENKVNKSQGNYLELNTINIELFELKSLVQKQSSQEKLHQSIEELKKANEKQIEMERDIQKILQKLQNQGDNLKQLIQNTFNDIQIIVSKIVQQNYQGDLQNKQQQLQQQCQPFDLDSLKILKLDQQPPKIEEQPNTIDKKSKFETFQKTQNQKNQDDYNENKSNKQLEQNDDKQYSGQKQPVDKKKIHINEKEEIMKKYSQQIQKQNSGQKSQFEVQPGVNEKQETNQQQHSKDKSPEKPIQEKPYHPVNTTLIPQKVSGSQNKQQGRMLTSMFNAQKKS